MRALASIPVSDLAALSSAFDALGLPAIGGAYLMGLVAPDREVVCGTRGECVSRAHGFQTGDGPFSIDGEDRWWISLDENRGKLATSVADALSGKATPIGWPPTGVLVVRCTEDTERLYWPPRFADGG